MSNYERLYNPQSMPILALKSAVAATALKKGEWSLIQNWRWDRLSLRVRDGVQALSSSALIASAEYRGHWEGTLNGTNYIILALKDGSAVKLVKINDLTAAVGSWAATEITAASGPYGSTRFTTTANYVSFAAVRDNVDGRDVLIAGNGAEFCRVYDPQGDSHTGATTVSIHQTITPPTQGYDHKARFHFSENFPIGGVTPTFSNAALELELSNSSAGSAENYVILTAYAAVDDGDEAIYITPGSTPDTEGFTFFILLVETAYVTMLDHLKIALRKNGTSTYVEQYNPTTALMIREEIPIDPLGTKMLVKIPLNEVTDGQSFDRVKFTWSGAAPSGNQTMNIYGMWFGGTVTGGTQIGLTYATKAARSECYGQVISAGVTGDLLENIGGTSLTKLRLPIFEQIPYTINIRAKRPETAGEVDTVRVYVQFPGSTLFMYNTSSALSSWNGSAWSATAGATGYLSLTVGASSGQLVLNPAAIMPDAQHVTIPKAKYLLWANDRLWAGNVSGASAEAWFSADRNAFQFRAGVQVDSFGIFVPRSPGRLEIGTEVVQGFATIPGTAPGLNTIYIFSDTTLYEVEGIDSFSLSRRRRKALLGTLSPRSICTYRSDVYWVDNDMQVRVLSGGIIYELSRYSVDDKLQAVPAARRDDIVSAVFKDRLYIAYSSSGATTNDRLLVFNLVEKKWEADDAIPSPCTAEGMFVWLDRTNNRPRLMMIGSDAKIYEYEAKGITQDLGANISTRLTTGELTEDIWGDIFISRLGFVMDDVASGTLACTVTYKPEGNVGTFSALSIDVSENQTHHWLDSQAQSFSVADPAYGKHGGITAQVNIQGSLLGGKVLHSIVYENKPGDKPRARTQTV